MSSSSRIEQIKKFLEETPEDAFLLHALAMEYLSLGDKLSAIACFEKNISLHADYLGSYYQLAILLAQEGNLEKARHYFDKGIEIAKQIQDLKTASELASAKWEYLE
jgi:tetratricopeptide (TPR) repeat protein